MTFWPLTNSDFPTDQTFHQFHDLYTELDLHRIMSGFHGAFATGVASQQGTLTLRDTWFRPPFWDLLMLQLLRPNSSNLPCLYSTFHLEYPLVLSRFCFRSRKYNASKIIRFLFKNDIPLEVRCILWKVSFYILHCIIPHIIDMTNKKYDWSREVTWRENKIVVFPSRRRVSLLCLTAQRSALYNVVLQLSV